jgi:hypothetical protein
MSHKHDFKYAGEGTGEYEDEKQNKPEKVVIKAPVRIYKCSCGMGCAE